MSRETWDAARPAILTGLVLLTVVFAVLLALQFRQVLALLFLGVVLGVTLNPFTDWMARFRVPKVLAILVVYMVVALLLALVLAYAAFEVSNQDLSRELDELREDYRRIQEGTALPSVEEVEHGLESLGRRFLSDAAGQVMGVLAALVGIASILVTAILFATTQDRLRDACLSFASPADRPRIEQVLGKYAVGLRGFARAELVAMVTIGVVTFIGLSILGVKLAIILALIAFVMEILPLIGPWIAFVPAFLVALTQSPWLAVQVSILYLAIQTFESYVLTPLVHSRESEVPALLIFVAITVGGVLMGILGALIALPIAVLLRITYIEVVKPWNARRHGESEDVGQGEEEAQEPLEAT